MPIAAPPQQVGAASVRVCYDIVHSPTYQVPVLYLSFPGRSLPQPDVVYDLVVPNAQKHQVRDIGVMVGALSMTEHPLTGMPAYFVHPCRTQEAMLAVTGGQTVSSERYLLLWLGVVGPSVSLAVPLALAKRLPGVAGDA